MDKSDKKDKDISKILHQKRLDNKTCGMWKNVGIKLLGDKGLYDDLLDWEKRYYDRYHRKKRIDERNTSN